MSFNKTKLKIIFFAVFLILGGVFISIFIDGTVSAKNENTSSGANITQYFTADVSGSNNVVGNANYKVFEGGNKEFSFFLLVSGLANGTTLTVEIDNVVTSQAVVSAGQISGTIASPETIPPVNENSVVTVKNGSETLSSGIFRLTVIRPLTIYFADGVGSRVLPAVDTDAVASGILLIDEGSSLAEVLVIGTAFTSAPLSVTINGPAGIDENGPVVFNFDNIQSFPNNDSILFLARGFVELNPLFLGQLNEGLLYINVKTPEFPNGEVRGQFGKYNPNEDFEGDGKADISLYRPSNGNWYFLNSSNQQVRAVPFGGATDKIVPGDYDGDGITDIAVFRKSNGLGYWNLKCSSGASVVETQWGLATDIPVVADLDGDGRDDLTVFRPQTGIWYSLRSSDVIKPRGETNGFGEISITSWGINGDIPFAGDFDGDGKSDLTVYRPSTGFWYVLNSSNNQVRAAKWGLETDIPLIGDFDGNGRSDVAVFRPTDGIWYVLQNLTEPSYYRFGTNGDIPTAADYDGDGRTDYSVYRPSLGTWYAVNSSANQFSAIKFGLDGDIPTSAP